ncbi:hypothetical protein ACFSQU_09615 [Massilia sp. GCM10020059]|uniref:Uncharacterized protein n=1 Tax=Massilia agrisoli TaxID=2892444 RepID=A0ABS8INW2_9BURK|nr:hypothetical protein [Massilia agrisoli]MCC6069513.1 hypothetical protein [Massilia agrisoli]
MKKIAPYIILFLVALIAWDMFADTSGFHMDIDGEEFDGPLGALLGLLFGSLGLIIGTIVAVCVGALLVVVFAGVGVMLVGALALAACLGLLAVSPLLLPLLIPVAIVWFFVSRSRRNRMKQEAPAI